jgi:hypothetical protein
LQHPCEPYYLLILIIFKKSLSTIYALFIISCGAYLPHMATAYLNFIG